MSTSRLEKFIYAICSMEVSDLPAPLSRIEILWNCLITGETPDFEPQSRNEKYLMAMLGLYELENLPAPMSRGEKLLYKIAMGETDLSDIPAYLSRYEELLGYLAENGGVGDFEYILQTLNQRLSTLYSTKERPMKQAVIKGDTLVNELQRPSLKNTMTNVSSQKLNQGYNNGKTLVNLITKKNHNKPYTIADRNIAINPNTKYIAFFDLLNVNVTTNIDVGAFIITSSTETTYNIGDNADVLYTFNVKDGLGSEHRISRDAKSLIFTSGANEKWLHIRTGGSVFNFAYDNLMIIEYQDGMENWDIPYFEGTKTFSATPNVVDGEFKQAVVKGQTDHKNVNWMTNFHYQYGLNLSTGKVEYISRDNRCSTRIEIDENRSFIFKAPSDIYISIVTADVNNNNLRDYGWYITTTDEIRFTVEDNCKFLYLNFKKPNESAFISESEIINSGLIVKEQKLVSVQLSKVTTTGKNLHHGENMSNGYVATNGNIDRGNISNSLSDYIKVDPSTSYAYKCFVENQTSIYGEFAFYDEDKKFISVLYSHHTSNTCIITPDNCHYLRVWNNQYRNNGDSHPNAMLVKTTNLPSTLIYEPYRSNTLTLAEPVNLRKVGDVEDEFDALTGQVTERVGEIVLDGDDGYTWAIHTISTKTIRFQSINIPIPVQPNPDLLPNLICDKFNVVKNSDWRNDEEQVEVGTGLKFEHEISFRVSKEKLTGNTVEAFQQYLRSNPITIQCQLATPTTKTVNTTITDQDGATQTKLHSFNDGYLSVSSQVLLPSAVNYEVPTNNSYYLPDMLTLGAQYTARGSADCNATIDGKLLALGKNRTFTTPSSVTDRLMVLDTPVDDLMFIKGDQTAKDFGYFEGMKSVEMTGIQVTGKNKFDGVSYIDGYIFGGGNTKVKPDNNVTSILVNLEKNTNYILSTKTSFDRSIIGGSTTPISINSYVNVIDCEKIDSRILFNSGEYTYFIIYLNNGKIELIDLQVEKGSVATPYEPYKSTTLMLNEPVILRKVRDVQDTLDGLTGEVTERIGEIMLNESLNYQGSSSANGENTMYFQLDLGAYPNSIPVSSHFKVSSANLYVSTNDYEGIRITGSGSLQLRVLKSKLNSLDVKGLKEYLKQNNISLQYQLATESIKTVDLTTVDQDGQSTKLKTFNDISYVEINADNLIPSVDVEVATKISETLATLDPQQLDISDTQNKLSQTIDEQTENTDATMMATTEIYEQTL